MTLRSRLLATLAMLVACVAHAEGASTVERAFTAPITVALVSDDASHGQNNVGSDVPDRALDRAVKWLERRELQKNISPTEASLFADAADGSLDKHGLIEAALIAEGIVDPLKRAECLETFDVAYDQLSQIIDASASEERRAEVLLNFLHRKLFFGGYRVDCTQLSEVLSCGQFNCASATIVFCAFAQRLGLQTIAIEVPGHVLCGLSIGENRIAVETTCPGWLSTPNRDLPRNPLVNNMKLPRASQQPASDSMGIAGTSLATQLGGPPQTLDARRFEPSQAGAIAWRQEMPVSALVAIVYYNRGLDELEQKKYAAAAVANVNALRINPGSPAAWSNLLATVNNWALAANQRDEISRATALLREGIELAPNNELFQTNLKTVNRRCREATGL